MQKQATHTLFTSILSRNNPTATAHIQGNANHPHLFGLVHFYPTPFGGLLVNAEINGLPDAGFHGLHIHEFGDCTPPFDKTGSHYNPTAAPHPNHSGDMPPLLSNKGYAWMNFYTDRLRMEDIIGKSVVIHSMPDDFTTQPAGDSGDKIGCGVIRSVM